MHFDMSRWMPRNRSNSHPSIRIPLKLMLTERIIIILKSLEILVITEKWNFGLLRNFDKGAPWRNYQKFVYYVYTDRLPLIAAFIFFFIQTN